MQPLGRFGKSGVRNVPDRPRGNRRLAAIRTLHTVVWAFFVACIGAIPVLAWRREFTGALLCIGLVGAEVLVLAFNRWRCPLTPIAARYTEVQPDNFDIYLPLWLAR